MASACSPLRTVARASVALVPRPMASVSGRCAIPRLTQASAGRDAQGASCSTRPAVCEAAVPQAQHAQNQASTASQLLSALPAASLALLLLPGACQAAEVDPSTAALIEDVLRPLFNIFTLLYIVRIPMTWYPNLNIKEMPWVVFCAPTEPFLGLTRKIVPLVGGVDVTPIVWVAMISFFNEVLLGPQGILTLIQRQVPGAPLM